MEKDIKAKVISEIKDAVLRYRMVDKGDHIVFGLSGGPDSVCLFFAFYLLQEELGITMSAVHVNHKFRPGAAEEDQLYVEELCERLGIRCRSEVYDCAAIAEKLGITSEEAGRKVRYEAFDSEALYVQEHLNISKSQIKIAVAHNMEDQAETLLFRIMRGTGTDGLAGIERKRTSERGYTIIRPILGLERRDIEAFCDEFKLAPHIDHTNLEPVYTRNKIRLGLIPYMRENFNENITEALNRLAVIAGEDKEYLWQQAEKCYDEARKCAVGSDTGTDEYGGSEITLNIEVMRRAPAPIRHRVILKAFSKLGLTQDIGAVHMDAADSIIRRGVTGKTAQFPYGYSAVTRYGDIVFKKPETAGIGIGREEEVLTLAARVISLEEWHRYEKLKNEEGAPKNFAAFDYTAFCRAKCVQRGSDADEIKGAGIYADLCANVVLRRKEEGDFITLNIGRKKIQDLLVDSKVPRDMRDSVILAAAGSEILWVIGADSGIEGALPLKSRFTVNYKISQDSKEVLLLEIRI